MANVDIDLGDGKPVNVDIDGLENLAPADQQNAVMRVAAAIRAGQGGTAPGNPSGGVQPASLPSGTGSSPASSTPPQPAPDTSLGGAFRHGLHDAVAGIGGTVGLVGQQLGSSTLQNVGKSIAGAVADDPGYQPTDIGNQVSQGHYSAALSQLPRAIANAAPDMAGQIGAGALGGAVGGPLGAGAGVAAYTAGRNLGDNVAARQANNGDATPSTGDLIGGGLTTATQAALAAIGLGRAPGVSGAVESIANPLLRSGAKVALEGAGAASMDAAGQVGTSVGTNAGLRLDPSEVLEAGATGALTRAAGESASLARTGVQEAANAGLAATMERPATVQDAQSIARVRTMADTAAAQAQATRGDTSATAVLNSVKTELASNILGYAGQLHDVGLIDAGQLRTIRTVTTDQALRHNNTITEGGAGPATLFDAVNRLPLPDEVVQPLVDGIRDLNTASDQSFLRNQVGPFQAAGRIIGRFGTVGAGIISGDPMHAMAGILGHGLGATAGSAVGATLDRAFGTATPSIGLRARGADAMLAKAGVEEGPTSLQSLQDASGAVQDIAPIIANVQAARTVQDYNRQAGADFANAAEQDGATLDRQAQQADTLKQSQTDAAWQSNAATLAQAQANLAASDQAQARAQAAVDAQRSATVNGYLNSPAAPPASASLGAQTSAEIAGWSQALRNKAALAALRQRQLAVLNTADASTVGSLAQAKVDRAARGNAMALAADGLAPTARSDITDPATAATLANAAAAAARVRSQALAGQDMADRITVGLPPTDPVPVNTPLDASGRPLQGSSGPTPTRAPAAAQPAPMDSGGASTATPGPAVGAPLTGWRRYADAGRGHTVEDIDGALDQAVRAGLYSPRTAAAMKAYPGPMDPAHLQPLQAILRSSPGPSAGASAGGSQGAPLGGGGARAEAPGGSRGPIFDAAKWHQARADYQAHAAGKMDLAAGHPTLQAAILNVRDAPSLSAKVRIASIFIADAAEPMKSLAREVLSGPLLSSKVQ